MSVRVYGNQHGTFVRVDGEHLGLVDAYARETGLSREEAMNKMLSDYATRVLKDKENPPLDGTGK